MKLADYLSQHDLSAAAFAGRVGVPVSTITRVLRGEREPRLRTIERIVAATNGSVEVADFLAAPAEKLPERAA